jgi:hypothetical protein
VAVAVAVALIVPVSVPSVCLHALTRCSSFVSQPQRYKPNVLEAGRSTVCRVQYCHVISPIYDWCMNVSRNQFSIIKKLVSFVYFLFRSGGCCISYKRTAVSTVPGLPMFHSAKVGNPYRVTKTLGGAEELRHKETGHSLNQWFPNRGR